MKNKFTKADLKYGYLVVFKNDKKALVMPGKTEDCFAFEELGSCLLLSEFDDDLKYIMHQYKGIAGGYDIEKVYGFARACETLVFSEKGRDLIWERKEVKQMTVEEMKARLENLTGNLIEVIPSRNDMIATCYQFCESQDDDCISCEFGGHYSCRFARLQDEELKEHYEKIKEVKEDGRD